MNIKKMNIKKLAYNVFILTPFGVIIIIFVIMCKTIATIFQPYLYNKDKHKSYSELRRERWLNNCVRNHYIKYPPEYGTFLGMAPWGYDDILSEDEDILSEDEDEDSQFE